MTPQVKKWLKFTIRWGIAVFGILWVLLNLSFRDRVMILDPVTSRPDYIQVVGNAKETDRVFRIAPDDGPVREVARKDLWVRPDRSAVQIRTESGQIRKYKLLAVKPGDAAYKGRAIRELLVLDPHTGGGYAVDPSRVVEADDMTISSPFVEIGLIRMVREADTGFLIGAVFILPLSYLLTSLRWHLLLRGMEIRIAQSRAFVLNMVGAFYNAFMPGTTGGHVIKAYYAAKQTPYRTRAVMSVIVDRGIGLLALILLGGAMAAYHWDIPDCRRVAIGAALMIVAVVVGAVVFYVPWLRKGTGLQFVMNRMPMQKTVRNATSALEMYGRRPIYPLLALLMSFPVHATTIVSATLAGKAFGLGMSLFYYWVVVPVVTLVGAIPISPQGAGVMEFFAVQLTKRHGVTVSQAFALVMSIRLVAMFWNLVAGVFVLRGGFHAPTDEEQRGMESDATEPPSPPRGPSPATAYDAGGGGAAILTGTGGADDLAPNAGAQPR